MKLLLRFNSAGLFFLAPDLGGGATAAQVVSVDETFGPDVVVETQLDSPNGLVPYAAQSQNEGMIVVSFQTGAGAA